MIENLTRCYIKAKKGNRQLSCHRANNNYPNMLSLVSASKAQIEGMLLKHRLIAHSKNPFKGDRKVVVAMGD